MGIGFGENFFVHVGPPKRQCLMGNVGGVRPGLRLPQGVRTAAACGLPGGGGGHLPPRLQRRFTVLAVPELREETLERMFAGLLGAALHPAGGLRVPTCCPPRDELLFPGIDLSGGGALFAHMDCMPACYNVTGNVT